mmetsp:Transcript_101044/g.253388  ORF Transcript_101044/g.253388 Transcript_101044/m.253388 type:complete len:212 (+) Transcript_101044:1097-1732(+)
MSSSVMPTSVSMSSNPFTSRVSAYLCSPTSARNSTTEFVMSTSWYESPSSLWPTALLAVTRGAKACGAAAGTCKSKQGASGTSAASRTSCIGLRFASALAVMLTVPKLEVELPEMLRTGLGAPALKMALWPAGATATLGTASRTATVGGADAPVAAVGTARCPAVGATGAETAGHATDPLSAAEGWTEVMSSERRVRQMSMENTSMAFSCK